MSKNDQKMQAWSNQAQASNAQQQVARVMNDETWALLARSINQSLELTGSQSLLDVGCGNAYLLSLLTIDDKKTWGVDFALNMVNEAKKRLPNANFAQGEANSIPFSGPFQRILSYSIFHYFPDESYVKAVLKKLLSLAAPNGVILIGDLLDKQFEEQIKSGSDLKIEASLPIIHRYSQWLFIDLTNLVQWLRFQPSVASVEILEQPSEFTLSWYRKDLKISLN